MEQHTSTTVGRPHPVHIQVARMLQVWTALWLTGSLVAEAVANAAAAAKGSQAMVVVPGTIGVVVRFAFPPPIIDIILVCVFSGFVTYMALRYVCEAKWVTEWQKVTDCWKEKHWYNPWDWFTTLVCVVTWVAVQVLRVICAWKEVLVIVAVITCTLSVIVIYL